MALQVGSRLGHYDVTALIGEGGMGHVYQATGTKLNPPVALKVLPKAFAFDPDRRTRRSRMARNMLSLRSLGVVTAAVLAVPLVALHAGQPPGAAVPMGHCQVNSPRGTMPRCTLDDPATFDIAFRLTSSATLCGCTTDTV